MSFAGSNFPKSVLLFLPGDLESGAVYILDPKTGDWSLDFDNKQWGRYSVSQLEHLLEESAFSTLQSVRAFGAAV